MKATILTFILCSLGSGLAWDLCEGEKDEMYKGSNVDGSGVFVGSDRVTHPYKFPLIRKCWYDYFVTNSSLYNTLWRLSSGDTNCTGTSHCTVTLLTGTQSCQTRTEGVSLSIGLASPQVKEDGVAGAQANFGIGYSFSLSKEACYTASNTTACEWNDQGCHVVFTSQQLLKQTGYRRQRCNWGDGDKTQCLADTEINTPTDHTAYQCGAQCGSIEMIIVASSSSSLISITITQAPVTQSQTVTYTFTPSTSTSSTSSSSSSTSTFSSTSPTLLSPTLLQVTPTNLPAATSSTGLSLPSVVSSSSVSTGTKAGIGFGALAFVALFAALGICFTRKRKHHNPEIVESTPRRTKHNPGMKEYPPPYPAHSEGPYGRGYR